MVNVLRPLNPRALWDALKHAARRSITAPSIPVETVISILPFNQSILSFTHRLRSTMRRVTQDMARPQEPGGSKLC